MLIFRVPLSIFAACKARDTLVKILYAQLFQSIVKYINVAFECHQQTDHQITILDIAGFGKLSYFKIYKKNISFFHLENFETNRFEQFCINYSNEKIQNFCTKILIYDELSWYKSEGLEAPEIIFPGNEFVLGEYYPKANEKKINLIPITMCSFECIIRFVWEQNIWNFHSLEWRMSYVQSEYERIYAQSWHK